MYLDVGDCGGGEEGEEREEGEREGERVETGGWRSEVQLT